MFSPLAHLSLAHIADPTARRRHAERHQLERHPQAMLSERIAWGDQWVMAPDCAAASHAADPAFAATHFAELYWMRPPARAGAQAFLDLRERQVQAGRGPGDAAEQPLDDFFVPLKGYVAPRALVFPDALPFRPATGLHLTISRFGPDRVAAEDRYRWYDQAHIPAILGCPGVAGAWSFAAATLFRPGRDLGQPALRVLAVYLDRDPLRFAEALAVLPVPASTVETPLFTGLFRSITPWRWDWFEKP